MHHSPSKLALLLAAGTLALSACVSQKAEDERLIRALEEDIAADEAAMAAEEAEMAAEEETEAGSTESEEQE